MHSESLRVMLPLPANFQAAQTLASNFFGSEVEPHGFRCKVW